MEEILNTFNENRYKWEYKYYGYINKLVAYDKDDIANEVLLRMITKYNEGKIDMSNLKNYMFITYRNYVNELTIKEKTDSFREIKDDYLTNDTEEIIEIEKDPRLTMILGIIGKSKYNELLKYYDRDNYRLNSNIIDYEDDDEITPILEFNKSDRRRYIDWRRKIKMGLKEKNML